MQSKQYSQGSLEFITFHSKSNRIVKSKNMYLYNGKYYSSEYVAVEYFKSRGYDAFFSENTTWKNLLRALFKDIFKKFERLGKEKCYKKDFYDNEFFKAYETEINARFDYLRKSNLEEEVSKHSIKEWIKYRILKMCRQIEKERILAILYYIIQDYAHNHVGFPDLFVFNDEDYFFCEVKSRNDILKPIQVKRHELLLNNGIDVCVFGINKKSSWIQDEQAKYFNEDYIDEKNFIEVYDYKMKKANETYERFMDSQIEEIKNEFIYKYGLDAFVGFLNVISRKDKVIIDKYTINQSKREAEKIKNLRHLSRGMYYEERGFYSKAIEEYKQVGTYERFERLYECHRRMKDGESQVNLIYHVLNDEDNVPYKTRTFFERNADRLFRKKRSITTYDADEICPICGSMVKLTTLRKKNNISIFTCTRHGCYWYGGVYKGDLRKFTKIE